MRSGVVAFAAMLVMSAPALADEQCLIIGQHCRDLHDYLISVAADATIEDMRKRVSAIMMAEFFPDYPADHTMRCTPRAALDGLLVGKSYRRISTPFPPATKTPPLAEYLVESGERYCYINRVSEGTS